MLWCSRMGRHQLRSLENIRTSREKKEATAPYSLLRRDADVVALAGKGGGVGYSEDGGFVRVTTYPNRFRYA